MTRSTRLFELRTLVIETATDACSVALFQHGEPIGARHEVIGRGHAERLIALIAELPDGGRADQILVSCGPGSFTGIRVGVAAARGLGLGWGCPVTGYATLAAVAAQAFSDGIDAESLAVVMHGGHGEVFVQRFARAPFVALDDVSSLPVADAALVLADEHIVGTAAADLVQARGFGTAFTPILAAAAAALLPEHLLSLAPTPIYGRGADAKPMQ